MWKDLSLRDKAEIIKIGVQSGIYNLSDIQDAYNKFEDGGYKTKRLPNGSYAVQDVDKSGNPIQSRYIGGTTKQARNKYWEQAPIVRHAVDSIAGEYNINPQLLRDRLNHEGFVDEAINTHNALLKDKQRSRYSSNYRILNTADHGDAFGYFGLDDVGTLIEEGKVHPINERYTTDTYVNEKGREVYTAIGDTTKDNIGLMAATLQYLRSQAAKDFPNQSNKFLDDAASAYYNRGLTGGKNYMKKRLNRHK